MLRKNSLFLLCVSRETQPYHVLAYRVVVVLPSLSTLCRFNDRANLPIFQNKTAITKIPTVPANSSANTVGSIEEVTSTGAVEGPLGARGGAGVSEWV